MTVDEYIAHLRQFPPDAVVLIDDAPEWGNTREAPPPRQGYAYDTGGQTKNGGRMFRPCRCTVSVAVPVVYVG